MPICKQCGNERPVLRSASKPEGQRFVGMCKPCITNEMHNLRREAQDKLASIFSSIFG